MKGLHIYILEGVLFFFIVSYYQLGYCKDPLSKFDGTEGWEYIDTTKTNEEELWNEVETLIEYQEELKMVLEYERNLIQKLRSELNYSDNEGEEEKYYLNYKDYKERQELIETLRKTYGLGIERRDKEGQVIDEEKPWEK